MNKKQAIGLSVIGALALVILLLAVTGARAEPEAAQPAVSVAQAGIVSSTISYQGRLLDSSGNPVDGTPLITFSLYSQPSGGSLLWQDWFDTPVSDGLFYISLAPPPSLFDGRPLWLAVRVQGDPAELAPRQQILPAPYALSLRPGALVSTSLPSAPILRLVNASSGQALSLHSRADTALWAVSDAPFPAIYAENAAAGTGLRGDSASGAGVLGLGLTAGVKGQSTSGSGGTFTSTTGAGLFASSVAGHALVTQGPSLVQGPNPQQIALLRWYPAIQTPFSFTVGDNPHGIAFDGANIWVANSGDGTVSVLRASDGSHVMTPTVGAVPVAIAFDGANMWAVNGGDGTVSVLRASDGAHVMTPTAGSDPTAIAFDGTNMWVANHSGTVNVLRASDGSHVMTSTVGLCPNGIAFDGANMWVTRQDSRTVSVLRASDGSHVMTPTVGSSPQGIAFDGANMWVANSGDGTVSVLRASDGAHVMTATVGSDPTAIAFDGANMWITNYDDDTVGVLRASDGSHVATLTVGFKPNGVAFDGANMWVTNSWSDTVSKR